MAKRTLIRGGILLTMAADEPPLQGDVWVEGDRLVAVGERGQPFEMSQAEAVIDAEGCAVLPGLINAHTHTPMTLMRGTADDLAAPDAGRPPIFPPGQDWTGNLTPDDHYWSSRLAIAEMIRSGTTMFVDMYRDMDRVAQAVLDSGLRAALGWEILTFRNDPVEWLPYDEPTARRTFEESARFAADWNGRGEGRVRTLIAPHELGTCHEPWLTRAAGLARELKLPITIHVAEAEWEVELCRRKYNLRPVQVLEQAGILEHVVIGAHSLLITDDDLPILAPARYTAAACLGAYLKLATPATPIAKLIDAGVNVALGTDSAQTNNNLNLWEEIHLAATLPAFLARNASLVPADLALRMATVGGARALGLEQELGSLEPGKQADLIILDLRRPHLQPIEAVLAGNLAYAASGHEVRDVMVAGRVLMRAGTITAFDEAEVLRQAQATVRRLRREVGLPERLTRP